LLISHLSLDETNWMARVAHNFLQFRSLVHKEGERRRAKFSFLSNLLVATIAVFTSAQLTAQSVANKISQCTTGIDTRTLMHLTVHQDGWRNFKSIGHFAVVSCAFF
jgi:hypothetical protein